jgi:hypothetical protein
MMTSQNLENLAKTGQLKKEPPNQREFDGLVVDPGTLFNC